MTHCSGCGAVLGWKKYRFQKMWRIPGYYCRECMLELGGDFDRHARITTPSRACGLCGVEYYFLKQGPGGGHKKYCSVCREAVANGAVAAPGKAPAQPKNLPLVMMVFVGLGGTMMVLGLAFTMLSTGSDANVVNILFGAATTALGFVLLRKTLRSRSLLMGGRPQVSPAGRP